MISAGDRATRHASVPVEQMDAVVTHHMNAFASGVARFNEILAAHLGLPLLSLPEAMADSTRPLLSFKVSELGPTLGSQLAARLDDTAEWQSQLFLHEWCGSDLELRLVARAARVFCGNLEVLEQVAPLHHAADVVWTPGLLQDTRLYEPAQVSVFSFGMAHKIRVDEFRRLRELLESTKRSYIVTVSSANHETASIRDAQSVFEEMRRIFPRGLYFMGNLSDVAIFNELQTATFFAAFFESGVRANNTSVAAAMEQGVVVITNLDRYSPPEFQHMVNVIDIEQADALPTDPLVLRRISVAAIETARSRGWDQLVARMR